jgi:phage shock protein PspC (stress-responsive transcriptional regulator)
MNEITRIHLGRQPFIIAVDAQKELKAYMAAIEKQAGEDVVKEVELRMAELLTERGITDNKTVLAADVDFLKQQLGSPKDFKEDDNEADQEVSDTSDRRLFRDTENGMLAGVSAGLANYFGIDPLLVRLAFVIGVITGGWGILAYVVLWLLVPEAKTSSERLLMQGKAVTVESIKEAVERADVKGATKRANSTVAPVINSVFRVFLKILGVGFILAGVASIFGLIVVRTYMAAHHGKLFEENLFPVGSTEQLLADLGLTLAGLLAVFLIICGVAIFKRRWPIKGWITGVLTAIFVIALAVTLALTAGVAPKVRDRYLSRSHTQTRSVQPFQDVVIQGKDVDYQWEYADTYSVSIHYFDNPDVSKIKTTVSNNLLTIDTSNYQRERNCDMLCIFPAYNLLVTVKGPQPLPIPSPVSTPKHIIPKPYQD